MRKYWWMFDGLFAPAIGMIIYFLVLFWRYKGITIPYHLMLTICVIFSILFLSIFLYKLHFMPRLDDPYDIPWPSFICMIVMGTLVAMGYAFHFLFKLAFQDCPHVSDGDIITLLIRSTQRAGLVVFVILSVFYLIRRANFGSLNTCFDTLTRTMFNTTLVLFRLDLIGSKVYGTIEELCQDETVQMALEIFCPEETHNHLQGNINYCNASTEKELVWVGLSKNLLYPGIISLATEFIPVLLVVHWLVCGYGEKRAEFLAKKKMLTSALKMPGFVFNMALPEGSIRPPAKPLNAPPIPSWSENIMKNLSKILFGTGFLIWLFSFYLYLRMNGVKDGIPILQSPSDNLINESVSVTKFVFALTQIVLRILLYNWTRKIPCETLDVIYRADSFVDKLMMFTTLPFMVPASLAQFLERLYFFRTNGSGTSLLEAVVLLDAPILLNIVSKWLEAFSLCTLISLPKTVLHQHKGLFQDLIIASIGLNFFDFFSTYFSLDEIMHHIDYFIASFRVKGNIFDEVFTIIGVLAKLLTFSNFLFTFTCALAWCELFLRYRKQKAIYKAVKVERIEGTISRQNRDSLNNGENTARPC
uniref:Uncharacterized protein n=1 Tax=Meloidogyne incognita TaxID=6306 RepID=A0A914LNR3_MELIC